MVCKNRKLRTHEQYSGKNLAVSPFIRGNSSGSFCSFSELRREEYPASYSFNPAFSSPDATYSRNNWRPSPEPGARVSRMRSYITSGQGENGSLNLRGRVGGKEGRKRFPAGLRRRAAPPVAIQAPAGQRGRLARRPFLPPPRVQRLPGETSPPTPAPSARCCLWRYLPWWGSKKPPRAHRPSWPRACAPNLAASV